MNTEKELKQKDGSGSPATDVADTRDYDNESTGSQFLTFSLGGEEYGVDILRVQEIKGWVPVTRVPNTPSYMRGVLNLRGTIIPIIDLRMRFNLEEVAYTPLTVVIVLSVRDVNRERTLGIVVDGVSDVVNMATAEINSTPDLGAHAHTEFIKGLATVGETMMMLLDIDHLLSLDELQSMCEEGTASVVSDA